MSTFYNENQTNNINTYLKLLRKHKGLLEVNTKFPVKDNNALQLVYTPGVAAPCLEINKKHTDSYNYTNKMNTMLIITDTSEFSANTPPSASMAYLEPFCIYYKKTANIDCYPIIMDKNLIKDNKEFIETVYAISSSFSAIEFFGISEERVIAFEKFYKEKAEKNENKFLFVNGCRKINMSKDLKFDVSNIFSAVIRVLLDCQIYINAIDLIKYISNFLRENDNLFKEISMMNLFSRTNKLVAIIVKKVFESLKNGEYFSINLPEFNIDYQDLSEEYVKNKYEAFSISGESAWVCNLPKNYDHLKSSNNENALLLHKRYKGVIQTKSKIEFNDISALENLLTCRSNLGAIITNGTAILGLGDIGAVSGMPVMEGKSVLFKLYGGTDIIPICIEEKDSEKMITLIKRILPGLSIINLEDIKAPNCFTIENELNNFAEFPVFHDDQHGTAVVTLAGIINASKLKKVEDRSKLKIVMNGAGAAGLSVSNLLISYGFTNLIVCDTAGAIFTGRPKNMNAFKNDIAAITNPNKINGNLEDVLKNTDVFIGLSAPGALTQEMVKTMNKDPVIFALANPTPEIYPKEALEAGAFIVATGRSDFPNQINNSLAFPGIFRAAVDTKAKNITTEMKVAAAVGIANLIPEEDLRTDFIMPASLDTKVSKSVTMSVAEISKKSGEATLNPCDLYIAENINSWFLEGKLINEDDVFGK